MSSSHDLFVKGFLSNLTEAIDFFDSSLPKSITNLLDLEKLEPIKSLPLGVYKENISILNSDLSI
jgi:hypothetical protein